MCDKPGLTREHAPPYSFFPDDKRVNLITVPSCPTHNNRVSKDVEYVRNLVCSDFHANEVGQAVFQKAMRSFERSPKLLRQTYSRFREVIVNGERTAVYKINMTRFNRVMRGIAFALYYHDFQKRFPFSWVVYNATMLSDDEGFRGLPDEGNRRIRFGARQVPTADQDTNQPDVFRYGIQRGDEEFKVFYRLVFYGGVDIYVFGTRPIEGIENPPGAPRVYQVTS